MTFPARGETGSNGPALMVTKTDLAGTAYDTLNITDLPVHAFRAAHDQKDQPLLVIISGDGGWNGFIDGLAMTYSRDGIDVAGIDALKYFWHKSDPKAASDDFSKVIRYYASKWNKKSVILLGYSFGADVLPFVFNDFPADVKKMIPLVVMMSPSHHATFEFQLTGWFKDDENSPYRVVPEIKKITGPDKIIIYGNKEKETLVGDLSPSNIDFIAVDGGHHFNDDYMSLTTPVLKKYRAIIR